MTAGYTVPHLPVRTVQEPLYAVLYSTEIFHGDRLTRGRVRVTRGAAHIANISSSEIERVSPFASKSGCVGLSRGDMQKRENVSNLTKIKLNVFHIVGCSGEINHMFVDSSYQMRATTCMRRPLLLSISVRGFAPKLSFTKTVIENAKPEFCDLVLVDVGVLMHVLRWKAFG